ncbi:hypothetical protein V2J09_011459 [Rumex salicifolius]
MKLRERQDKLERMLSFNKTSKGGSFQEGGTRVKGEFDLLSAILLMDDSRLQNSDELCRAGIRTGIMSRITFETPVRQSDTLEMEFMSCQQNQDYFDCNLGSALSIGKVCYTANVTDWLSLVAIPIGGRCRDVAVQTRSCQERGLTDYSYGPPLLNSQNGGAICITARKSNVVASLAQFDSELGIQSDPNGFGHYLSTFGQIICQLPKSTKLSLMGLNRAPKLRQPRNLGALTIPFGIMKQKKPHDSSMEVRSDNASNGSLALMIESELDEYTKLKGWVQMENSSPRRIQWAVGMSDSPTGDEVGWGLNLVGMVNGPANQDRFQIEAFLKINMAKRFTLQPGVVYVMEGENKMPAIMFRSSWHF